MTAAYKFELIYTFGEFEPTTQQLQALLKSWTSQKFALAVDSNLVVEPILVYGGVTPTRVSDAIYADKRELMPGSPVESSPLIDDGEAS